MMVHHILGKYNDSLITFVAPDDSQRRKVLEDL
jgi:hypothetical protein